MSKLAFLKELIIQTVNSIEDEELLFLIYGLLMREANN